MKIKPETAKSIFKAVNTNSIDVKSKSAVAAARCHICGDSSKSKMKRRLYLCVSEDGRSTYVYCHNCQYKSGFNFYLKDFWPSEYTRERSNYYHDFGKGAIDEALKSYRSNHRADEKNKEAAKNIFSSINEVTEYLEERCVKLSEGHPDYNMEIADMVLYLKSRRIPWNIYKDWYISIKKFDSFFLSLLIPFFYNKKYPYMIQSRDVFFDRDPKWLFWVLEEPMKHLIYREYDVDPSKTVYISEGTFDSCNIENGCSNCGAGKISDSLVNHMKDKFPSRVWVFDNDEPDNYGIRKGQKSTLELLDRKESVFITPKEYIDCKDINDIALKMGVEIIPNDFLEANTYKGLKGVMLIKERMRK